MVRALDRRRRLRRPWLIGAAALVLLAGALAACQVASGQPPAATRTAALASYRGVTAGALARGRWSRLPAAPIPDRDYPAAVWTGRELLVWGGQSGPHDAVVHGDGAVYDPVRGTWRRLPLAPLTPRTGAATAWTGRELIVWGGYDHLAMDPASLHVAGDGAAYDPARGTWRRLPPAPLSARASATAIWTGREVLVVGAFRQCEPTGTAALLTGPPITRRTTPGGVWPQAPGCGVHWSISTWCGRACGCWCGATGSSSTARPSR